MVAVVSLRYGMPLSNGGTTAACCMPHQSRDLMSTRPRWPLIVATLEIHALLSRPNTQIKFSFPELSSSLVREGGDVGLSFY